METKDTSYSKKYDENTQETDVGKFVFCKAFGKLLKVEHCTKKRCNYHFGRKTENATQGDKVVQVFDNILCGYPKNIPVVMACEVD